jgi:putative transposase
MTVWRVYYHLVWATLDRLPLIVSEAEGELHDYIAGKSRSLSCPMHAINGVADHIHIVVSIPPDLSISSYVKRIKGSSSRFMNQINLPHKFAWQREYGVFSLGSKQLEQAIAYVQNQKQHHAQGTIVRPLELL